MTKLAITVLAGTIALAACSAPTQGPGTVLTPQRSSADEHARSWMLPEAKGDELVYLAGQQGDTYVYSYPSGKLVGTLSGLGGGQYECVDRVGDVFITTPTGIYEYAHGGTQPINFLPLAHSSGCAIDPVTGNLAVVAIGPTVFVYTNAQGTPTAYTDGALYVATDVAYDGKGDLLLDGQYHTGRFALDRLARGSSQFQSIITPENPYLQESTLQPIAWDGKYLDVGSYQKAKHSGRYQTVLFRLKISGSDATIKDTVPLTFQHGPAHPQFWIQGGVIVQPSNKVRSHSFFQSFEYPSGKSIEKVNLATPSNLWGAAISTAPSP